MAPSCSLAPARPPGGCCPRAPRGLWSAACRADPALPSSVGGSAPQPAVSWGSEKPGCRGCRPAGRRGCLGHSRLRIGVQSGPSLDGTRMRAPAGSSAQVPGPRDPRVRPRGRAGQQWAGGRSRCSGLSRDPQVHMHRALFGNKVFVDAVLGGSSWSRSASVPWCCPWTGRTRGETAGRGDWAAGTSRARTRRGWPPADPPGTWPRAAGALTLAPGVEKALGPGRGPRPPGRPGLRLRRPWEARGRCPPHQGGVPRDAGLSATPSPVPFPGLSGGSSVETRRCGRGPERTGPGLGAWQGARHLGAVACGSQARQSGWPAPRRVETSGPSSALSALLPLTAGRGRAWAPRRPPGDSAGTSRRRQRS